jgi:hypothetical protein
MLISPRRRCGNIRRYGLVRLLPKIIYVLAPRVTLLVNLLAVVGSMMSLGEELRRWAGLSTILICWALDLMSRSWHVSKIPQSKVVLIWRSSDHW